MDRRILSFFGGHPWLNSVLKWNKIWGGQIFVSVNACNLIVMKKKKKIVFLCNYCQADWSYIDLVYYLQCETSGNIISHS